MAPRNALVIDGDPHCACLVAETLRGMRFAVETAIRREDIERALEVRPTIVCVALTLPRGSGYDVCEMIRADARNALVQILMTGDRVTPTELAWAEDAGVNAFLRKPFTAEKLVKYVEALVEPARAIRPSVRRLLISAMPPPLPGDGPR